MGASVGSNWLSEAELRAHAESGVVTRTIGRLPCFGLPFALRRRRIGERLSAQWGVDAFAKVLIAARLGQTTVLLVVIATLLVGFGTWPVQLLGAAVDVGALLAGWHARRWIRASGIPSRQGGRRAAR